jgi:hypothetical protein
MGAPYSLSREPEQAGDHGRGRTPTGVAKRVGSDVSARTFGEVVEGTHELGIFHEERRGELS